MKNYFLTFSNRPIFSNVQGIMTAKAVATQTIQKEINYQKSAEIRITNQRINESTNHESTNQRINESLINESTNH